ncbi:MAG: hypothetical protein II572_07045 [Clostridia bacterium]|nr:hypothetical protein [Clostridia bacterium]
MLKRTLLLILISLMLLSSAACKSADPGKTDPAPSDTQTADPVPAETAAPENPVNVVDKNGTVIGVIDGRCSPSAADAGIFYSIWQPGENEKTATSEYHFFRAEDRKDLLLGTLPDQGYEAYYARKELDGIVYTLAVTGDPMDDKPDTLWLLAFDPMKGTMTQYPVSQYGFPYAALTAANGKLWIMNYEMDARRQDKIYEFDPADGTVKEVLSFDGMKEGQGSLRSIYSDGRKLYVLRLRDSGDGSALFLDSYDLSYQKISERSLNDFMIPAGRTIHGMTGDTDIQNEFGMMVSHFAVLEDRFLFYENFAIYRAVIDLETGEPLFASDDLHSISGGSGAPALYKLVFSYDELEQSEILVLRSGKLEKFAFIAPEGPAFTRSVSHSPSGNWLVMLADEAKERALCFFHEE